MKRENYLILLPLTLLLLGITTAYVPEGEYGGIPHGGYTSVMINQNTAMVTFKGSGGDSPLKIHRYLLYRCAQVAMENGYDYFVILSTSTSHVNTLIDEHRVTKQIYPPSVTPQSTYTEETIQGYRTYRSAASQCDMNEGSICNTRSAVAIIKMYSGLPPQDLPRAYLVDDVLAHYSPQ